MEYKKAKHHIYLINYHLIWCPKRRRKILLGALKQRLNNIIRGKAEQINVDIIEFVIQPDHIHLFVSCPPTLSAHNIVKSFKGLSSRILRKEFNFLMRMPSLWTHSYFSSTAGNVSSKTIQRYIKAQSKQ